MNDEKWRKSMEMVSKNRALAADMTAMRKDREVDVRDRAFAELKVRVIDLTILTSKMNLIIENLKYKVDVTQCGLSIYGRGGESVQSAFDKCHKEFSVAKEREDALDYENGCSICGNKDKDCYCCEGCGTDCGCCCTCGEDEEDDE